METKYECLMSFKSGTETHIKGEVKPFPAKLAKTLLQMKRIKVAEEPQESDDKSDTAKKSKKGKSNAD